MPTYEYRCDDCHDVTALFARIGAAPASCRCQRCGSAKTHRIVSRTSVHLSKLSKVERLDPKYDKMVDRAMRNSAHADPDRLIHRRGDPAKGRPDPD